MAIIVGALTTVLGLVFALLVTRTSSESEIQARYQGNERVAYYHSSFCDWAGHHFVVWTFRHCDHLYRQMFWELLQQDGFMDCQALFLPKRSPILQLPF